MVSPRPSNARWLVTAIVVFGLVLASAWLWSHTTRLVQHENSYNLSSCLPALNDYHEELHRYPPDLETLLAWRHPELAVGEGPAFCRGRRPVDSYDNPIFFESRGDRFVLVSLGSDGLVDIDPWLLREGEATWAGTDLSNPPFSVCGSRKSDAVYSDLGLHRGCLVK